jgi:multisubunit Na+/H+ antiporter MnhB subunit
VTLTIAAALIAAVLALGYLPGLFRARRMRDGVIFAALLCAGVMLWALWGLDIWRPDVSVALTRFIRDGLGLAYALPG